MIKPLAAAPLSEDELDELDDFLARVEGGEIRNVEALDGFLTALVICPELVKPSEYVPVITSGATEAGDLVFQTTAEPERFYELIMRHWNDINRVFRSGEVYMPVLGEDAAGEQYGNDWAIGFLAGTKLRYGVWDPVIQDEERGGAFIPLFALAYEHSDDLSLRPFDKPVTQEQREDLIAGMIAGVNGLYRHFVEAGKFSLSSTPKMQTFPPKTGRNEPCPCGSGKKFKKCCGQVTTYH